MLIYKQCEKLMMYLQESQRKHLPSEAAGGRGLEVCSQMLWHKIIFANITSLPFEQCALLAQGVMLQQVHYFGVH